MTTIELFLLLPRRSAARARLHPGRNLSAVQQFICLPQDLKKTKPESAKSVSAADEYGLEHPKGLAEESQEFLSATAVFRRRHLWSFSMRLAVPCNLALTDCIVLQPVKTEITVIKHSDRQSG